jgi:4-phospho-D-threonate 3-dehydrogenase / 4-phospho-D-erythronate 3-dehydrogenase
MIGSNGRPLVGVTLGDPAGIGPEIVVRALAEGGRPASSGQDAEADLYELTRPLVIGDHGVLERASRVLGVHLRLNLVQQAGEGRFEPGVVDLLEVTKLDLRSLEWGKVQAQAGQASFDYIRTAIDLALKGRIDAIATAPINKEALKVGGVPFLDHTAMLAKLTDSPDVLTMFVVRKMVIFFMARHMSMREACDEVTAENVCQTLLKAQAAMASFGQPGARFGVAALNPHAGEHGLFGDEEFKEIAPGVERAPCQATPSFISACRVASTPCWRSTMIRATSPPRRTTSSARSQLRRGCRSSAPPSTTARPSTSPARESPVPLV